MVSEISKTEKDTYCIVSSICGIYKSQTYRNRVEWWLPGAERWGKWGDVDQRAPTYSFTMNKF